ncbi:LAMI_0C05666g1_1 [Lachancea mirantina]|uniref:LAMI_0C05666g1_1 n=1 Tax=Lachancea mirantina TaxID=1230905 RepID=A0A1G4J2U3_9SACH|nr:LAMI_0C05666g1_1 [Lachancea mirantina]
MRLFIYANFLGVAWAGILNNQRQVLFEDEQDSILNQLFGEVLTPHVEGEIQDLSVGKKKYVLDDSETEEFRAQCGFYENHRISYPDDSFLSDIQLFSGIVTFAHVPMEQCFKSKDAENAPNYDIAILGAPFDTSVSYRPGARFGPNSIRQGSRRLGQGVLPVRGFPGSKLRTLDPYNAGYKIVDCGDVPMTPFDNRLALNALYRGERAVYKQSTNRTDLKVPKVITLGGDHTITLMALRAAYEHHGQMAVIHFDSHIDTWDPKVLGGGITKTQSINHGTFLHFAHEWGYIRDDKSLHVGLRAPYFDLYDEKHDRECGFDKIVARDFDLLNFKEIVKTIKDRVGDLPIYLTIDIDVLDLAFAPGTGTPEPGGLTSRELLTVLDGLEGLNIVGADVVEVAPAFDSNGEITSIVAAQVIDSILGLMVVS